MTQATLSVASDTQPIVLNTASLKISTVIEVSVINPRLSPVVSLSCFSLTLQLSSYFSLRLPRLSSTLSHGATLLPAVNQESRLY